MALKRTTVYADAEDLAIIKEAAAREGVPEAEIIREAIHLAALSKRSWTEPLDWPTFNGAAEQATADEADHIARRIVGPNFLDALLDRIVDPARPLHRLSDHPIAGPACRLPSPSRRHVNCRGPRRSGDNPFRSVACSTSLKLTPS